MSRFDYDVIVIGSGFGGSVAALRLAEKGYRVGILEAGRRFEAADFARTNWDLRRFLWAPHLGFHGIQRMNLLKNVLVLSGAGVGGGSLVYANTLYRPHEAFYEDPQWADVTDWKTELAPFFNLAERMLGVTEVPGETPADAVLRDVALHFGVEDTFRLTPVGVYFGEPGVTVADPYFGGVGPDRAGCTLHGGCMVGCRFNAKNTLDKNYLYLAEQAGARIYPAHEVVDLLPLPRGGYRVAARRPGSRRARRTFLANQVVLGAGALGTTRLLLELADRGRLPHLSSRIGHQVRTNSESIVGAVARSDVIDYSEGVAITSSIHPEPRTHIEAVRYPKGSNVMGLLGTVLTDGGGALPRFLGFLANAARDPMRFLRSLSVRRWSERSVILLVMQSYDNSIRLFRRRTPLGTRLTSRQDTGKPNPTYLPIGNEAARAAATSMGGDAMSAINEVFLDSPTTAHLLGGAVVAATSASGVVDGYHRVFGHPGLHVVDGASVGANLGVNPSLTITAMAERAMAMWPNREETDPRPPLGDRYEPRVAVRPAAAAVDPTVLGTDPWASPAADR